MSSKIVLLDDDQLVRMSWKVDAKKKGLELITFSNSNELINSLSSFSFEDRFYIDQNLKGDSMTGEQVIDLLFNKGFKNLFLATGYDPNEFLKNKKLKGIIGKRPPF